MANHTVAEAAGGAIGRWSTIVTESLTALWVKVAEFLPNLIGAIIILIVGYLIARLLRTVVRNLLRKAGIDRVSEKTNISETLKSMSIRSTPSEMISVVLFWLILLTFMISAAESIGLRNVSGTIDSLVNYLPNVIAAVLIGVIGLMVAQFIRGVVDAGARSIGLDFAGSLSRVAYYTLIVVVVMLAVDQLGIQTSLLEHVIQIVLLASGAALALAIGIGSRGIASHIVAGVYIREQFKPGGQLSTADVAGEIVSVGTISTTIRSADGELIHLPNADIANNTIRTS